MVTKVGRVGDGNEMMGSVFMRMDGWMDRLGDIDRRTKCECKGAWPGKPPWGSRGLARQAQ